MTSVCPKKFASTLPEPRFQRYLDYVEECSSNPSDDQTEIAVKLYAWNTALSATFYGPLQALEIALRNAIHKQMTNAFSETWYDNLPKEKLYQSVSLTQNNELKIKITLSKIQKIKKKLDREIDNLETEMPQLEKNKEELKWKIKGLKKGAEELKKMAKALEKKVEKLEKEINKLEKKKEESYAINYMVANLDLGFWVNLFYYKHLWKRGLNQVFFTQDLTRDLVFHRLGEVNKLRNHIAHHEPIFHRPNLEKDMQDILEILGWICPITRDWVEKHNRFDEVMKKCPIKRQ